MMFSLWSAGEADSPHPHLSELHKGIQEAVPHAGLEPDLISGSVRRRKLPRSDGRGRGDLPMSDVQT